MNKDQKVNIITKKFKPKLVKKFDKLVIFIK